MVLRLHVILLFSLLCYVESAKILGVFHIPSRSHHILGKTLLTALVEKGHQVTMISPFPLKTPIENYQDISVEELLDYHKREVVNKLIELENGNILDKIMYTIHVILKMNDICLNHTAVKNLLSSNTKFDLVIIDWSLTDAVLGIAHHFNAPVIALSPVGSTAMTNKITRNPAPYSYVPHLMLPFMDEMSFFERTANTLITVIFELYDYFFMEPYYDQLIQKYFPNAPPIAKLIQNISMVFLNSHISIESSRPYVPNMVQIAGMHVQKPKPLEPSLQKFMDDAKNGVLYFSLGSNANSSELAPEKLDSIISTFKRLPLNVLWKFEGNNVPKLPPHVKISKWFPQPDVLAHPNMKVFVTHGGLLSTIESVSRGVPMVGLPCFADQTANVHASVSRGYSTKVTIEDLNEETFTNAIMEILKNRRYKESAQKHSDLLRDQPSTPLENAVFWVEYVLRHRGAPHLQTSGTKLIWYQYLLLDVIGFLLAVAGIVLLAVVKIVKTLKRLIFKGNRSTTQKKNAEKRKKNI